MHSDYINIEITFDSISTNIIYKMPYSCTCALEQLTAIRPSARVTREVYCIKLKMVLSLTPYPRELDGLLVACAQ